MRNLGQNEQPTAAPVGAPVTERPFADAIGFWVLLLGAAGAAGFQLADGWTWSFGFALGAVLSGLNLRWMVAGIQAMVPDAGPGRRRQRRGWAGARFLGRFLLLGAALYAIFWLRVGAFPAVLAGLFVGVAGVFAAALQNSLGVRRAPGGAGGESRPARRRPVR